ncbi:MAG: hypothetical protein CM15mP90_4190 [Actinomycetota bacterium]|nr:MAG: hypothetical protein CM15mP90_4190 [Actinomycetota bacterium]
MEIQISGSLAGVAGSLTAASVTSFFAMVIATPIVVMISQYRSKFGDLFEKVTLTFMAFHTLQLGFQCYLLQLKFFQQFIKLL